MTNTGIGSDAQNGAPGGAETDLCRSRFSWPPLFFRLVLSITSIILVDFLEMIKLIRTYG